MALFGRICVDTMEPPPLLRTWFVAVISHGHADHLPLQRRVLTNAAVVYCSHQTYLIYMAKLAGANVDIVRPGDVRHVMSYPFCIPTGHILRFFDANHGFGLGSLMVLCVYRGESWLHTGDCRYDPAAMRPLAQPLDTTVDRATLSVLLDTFGLCERAVEQLDAPSWLSEGESIQFVVDQHGCMPPGTMGVFYCNAGVRAAARMALECARALGGRVFLKPRQEQWAADLRRSYPAFFTRTLAGARYAVLDHPPNAAGTLQVLEDLRASAGCEEGTVFYWGSGNLAKTDPRNVSRRSSRTPLSERCHRQFVPYMHHSTYAELVAFLRLVRPGGPIRSTPETCPENHALFNQLMIDAEL